MCQQDVRYLKRDIACDITDLDLLVEA